MESIKVVIVGGGQAGIAMGYYLVKEKGPFIILDANKQVGDSWRNRYDSLVLFTPRTYSQLPGFPMDGAPNGFPTKDEMASYLQQYASHFNLPMRHHTKVDRVTRQQNGRFHLKTNNGWIEAEKVVIATGAFQKPYLPPVLDSANDEMSQVHSSAYRNPAQIPGKSVLVVGGGNSGAQIAVELAKERNVTMAISHPFRFLPLKLLGKSMFSWLEWGGLLYAGVDTTRGRWFKKQKDPIFGKELKSLIKKDQIHLKPRVVNVQGKEVEFADHSRLSFDRIIWSTGFSPSYEWIDIDGVIATNGWPIHNRGITNIRGLYFLGLPWQYQRGSALVCGVGRDAEYLVPFIKHGDK